jgi:hypothetical protein
MFSAADVKTHKHKQPFVPFRLVTSAGESFDILHPELIMVGTREVTIGLPSHKDPTVYENQIWVAIMHIASIKELPVTGVSSAGNGKGS